MNQGVLVGVGNVGPQITGFPTYPTTGMMIYLNSGTWIAPQSGIATFYAVGAGGSGGVFGDNGVGSSPIKAVGGGAGGMCVKSISIQAGARYTVTVGAGVGTASFQSNGTAGGATTVTGPGISLVANGGSGGTITSSTFTLAGVTGGTASGGTINYTGGGSGSITGATTAANCWATGGGAVAWRNTGYSGTGYSSGSITSTGTSNSLATGGAGVGGASGSITTTGSISNIASSGGGSYGAAADMAVSASTKVGAIGLGISPASQSFSYGAAFTNFPGITAVDSGGLGYVAANNAAGSGYFGGGGGAAANNSGSGPMWGGNSWYFGGGGGTALYYLGTPDITSYTYGGYGGGGGGYALSGSYASGTLSKGGNGLVVIYLVN